MSVVLDGLRFPSFFLMKRERRGVGFSARRDVALSSVFHDQLLSFRAWGRKGVNFSPGEGGQGWGAPGFRSMA